MSTPIATSRACRSPNPPLAPAPARAHPSLPAATSNVRTEPSVPMRPPLSPSLPCGAADPQQCMRTVTGRCLNEYWRRYPFTAAITFHGGMRAVSYPWGAPNHKAPHSMSPDNTAYSALGSAMAAAAGPFQVRCMSPGCAAGACSADRQYLPPTSTGQGVPRRHYERCAQPSASPHFLRGCMHGLRSPVPLHTCSPQTSCTQ